MSLKDKIKKLIRIIKDTEIEEIEVSSFWGAQKIRLSKNSKTSNVSSGNPIASEIKQVSVPVDSSVAETLDTESISKDNISESKESSNQNNENSIYQNAPLVGTFYSSPKPGEPNFVQVGDKVSKGQTLCIIEAMKIFNEIESDFDGEIVEILVADSSPVEFNQPIFSIKEG